MFDIYEVGFEIYLEDKMINKQTMQAPQEMIMINFIQLVNQISKDERPIKIRMFRPEIIWDNFENKQNTLDNEVIFSNNAMIAWEESNQSNDTK